MDRRESGTSYEICSSSIYISIKVKKIVLKRGKRRKEEIKKRKEETKNEDENKKEKCKNKNP